MMRASGWLVLAALLAATAGQSAAQEAAQQDSLGARIWLDRGDDAVLNRGDRVSIYYEASADAYVAIFHIDTDGAVQLLYPRAADVGHMVQGNRDYQLIFPRSPYWYVDEYPGTGYYFIVASADPFDFSDFGYSPYEHGWNLSRVGRTVYRDPYLAMDDYVSHLIPDWRTANYALDFLTYYVGKVEPYPRFLCYECHQFRSYTDWNPYAYACSTFRVVIWDDPYFSPEDRYDGSRIVFARPEFGRPRFQFKERARGEPWSPLVRRRAAPPRDAVRIAQPTVGPPPTIAPRPMRRVVPGSPENRAVSPRRSAPGRSEPPAIQRSGAPRPGSVVAPARPSTRERPMLQRRSAVPTLRARPSDALPPSEAPRAVRRPGGGMMKRVPRSGTGAPDVTQRRGGSVERQAPGVRKEPPVRRGGGRPEARPVPRRQPASERPTVRPRSGGGGGPTRSRWHPAGRGHGRGG